MKRVVHSACPHDCPDACGALITVEDGRATRIQGDPAHPITQGFLCAKVAKYLDRVYSPDRVLYPMRRTAPKGSGGPEAFQRISWDEALDEIVAKLKHISAEFGPEAVLPYSYGGNLGVLNGASMDRRFFHRMRRLAVAENHLLHHRWRRDHVHVRTQDAAPSPNSSVTRNTSSPGPRISTATTSTCGRLSRRHGATARSWW